MKKLLATLVTLVMIVSSLAVLTSCSDGADGLVPTVGENGNWFIGETDTGVPATGPKGDTGATGAEGQKGDRGPDGATGSDAPAVEIPILRYNETDEVYEASYDNGATWEAIESVAGTPMELPATNANLLDATLAEYDYPMDQIIVSDLCITYFLDEDDPNWNKYMYAEGYKVAFINIEGTVFDKAIFTGNEASYMGWFWLQTMPYPGDAATKSIHPTGRGPGQETSPIDITKGATVLAVVYERPDDFTGEAQNVLPQGIRFINSSLQSAE